MNKDPELDREIVLKKLDELAEDRVFLRNYVDKGLKWILEDKSRTYAFERAMHRALESILDICKHFVTSLELGVVMSYSEYPKRLAEANYMDKELAETISNLAKLRNVLVHRYAELNYDLLFKEAKNLVENVIPAFSEWVKRQL